MISPDRSPAALAFSLLLVVSLVAGGVGGPDGHADLEDDDRALLIPSCASLSASIEVASLGVVDLDCAGEEDVGDKLKRVNAKEDWITTYETFNTERNSINILGTSLDNYLADARPAARMAGQNAYIRTMENQSQLNLGPAWGAANDSIDDYYARHQLTLQRVSDAQLITLNASWQTLQNHSNLSTSDVVKTGLSDFRVDELLIQDHNYSLLNGTEITAKSLHLNITRSAHDADWINITDPSNLTQPQSTGDPNIPEDTVHNITVIGPPNYRNFTYINGTSLKSRFDKIYSERSHVRSEVAAFINSSFDAYQQGEINISDLVDPGLAADEYSHHNDTTTWAALKAMEYGYALPGNMSEINSMKINTNADENLSGILLIDDERNISEGDTIKPSNVSGPVYFAFPEIEGIRELNAPFDVLEIRGMDGNISFVEYVDYNYSVASISEYENLMANLSDLKQDLNDRQDELADEAGGSGFSFDIDSDWLDGLIPDGLGGMLVSLLAVLLVGAVVLATVLPMLDNMGNGGNGGHNR